MKQLVLIIGLSDIIFCSVDGVYVIGFLARPISWMGSWTGLVLWVIEALQRTVSADICPIGIKGLESNKRTEDEKESSRYFYFVFPIHVVSSVSKIKAWRQHPV